jgi:hypothetical protein
MFYITVYCKFYSTFHSNLRDLFTKCFIEAFVLFSHYFSQYFCRIFLLYFYITLYCIFTEPFTVFFYNTNCRLPTLEATREMRLSASGGLHHHRVCLGLRLRASGRRRQVFAKKIIGGLRSVAI